MEPCAMNKEQFQSAAGDPDDVHITTSTLLESTQDVVKTSFKSVLANCVVNWEGDQTYGLLEGFPTANAGNQLQNVSAQESIAQLPLSEEEKVCEEDSVKSMVEMFNILHAKKRVKLEALVLNRDSFSRTAANVFALSLLVKDGRAEIKCEDQSYFIVPRNSNCHGTELSSEDNFKFMYQFNHEDWELMRQQVQAGEELMTNASSSGRAWPLVIPKGIRKKARKRTVFQQPEVAVKAADTASESQQMLDAPLGKSGTGIDSQHGQETVGDDSKIATDAADEGLQPTVEKCDLSDGGNETKPLKPLLTYSRRRKKQKDASEMQLLKRYSRRMMLNGESYIRKKTLLVFEGLIAKEECSSDDEETIFERLAKAPRRRRSGCTGAAEREAFDKARRNQLSYCVSTGASELTDDKLKGGGGGGGDEDVMVIAPKRFKKSAFGPRQALIAQVKARLKAILKLQGPPPIK